MAGTATSGTPPCSRRMGWRSIACTAILRAEAGSWRRAMTEYVELHARSAFSFLEGASLPEEMAAVCAELGMPAMALLDGNGVYGTARLHTAMKRLGLRGIVGAEIQVEKLGSAPFAHLRESSRLGPSLGKDKGASLRMTT